jgi:hypothetical protein
MYYWIEGTRYHVYTNTGSHTLTQIWYRYYAYVSNTYLDHHVSWPLVRNVELLWALVLKPFWNLPRDRRHKFIQLEERMSTFQSNLIRLLIEQSSGKAGASAEKAFSVESSFEDSDDDFEEGSNGKEVVESKEMKSNEEEEGCSNHP